jgi:hypothetical protein
MVSLEDIGLFVGILIILTRLPGLIWPEKCRNISLKFIQIPNLIRITGVFAFILSIFILYTILRNMNPLEIILVIIGFLWFVSGIIIIYKPSFYEKLSKLILGESLLRFRILAGLGTLIGASLLGLGIYYKYF